jgi:hypothetical protein
MAAEQAKPANAVPGPAPSTGIDPLAQQEREAAPAAQGALSRNRCASSAAMQPVPALVMACR